MKNRNMEISKYISEFREVATEARNGGDLKAISAFTNAAGKALSFMKFEYQINCKPRPRKKAV